MLLLFLQTPALIVRQRRLVRLLVLGRVNDRVDFCELRTL